MTPTCNILFLHRTRKKQKYFDHLIKNGFKSLNSINRPYHKLPKNAFQSVGINQYDLDFCLKKAEQEMFNGLDGFWVNALKPLALWLRKCQIRRLYKRLYGLLESSKPHLILIWNGHKYQDYVLKSVNQRFNIPIGFFEVGVLPTSTTLDFVGINAQNSVPKNPEFFQTIVATGYTPAPIVGRAYKQLTQQPFNVPSRYLLVPLQKERDSQILENSPWIKTMHTLVIQVAQALKHLNDPTLAVVFRPHPSDKTTFAALKKWVMTQPNLHWDSSMPLNTALQKAEAVITINSSVGMEAILLAKKVVVLGDAFYALNGLCLKAKNAIELQQCLHQLHDFKPEEPLRSQFITYLHQEYSIPGDWQKPDHAHIKSLIKKIAPYLIQ